MFDKGLEPNIHSRFATVGELRDAIIRVRDTTLSSDDDPKTIEEEIRELANGVRNREIARNRAVTQEASNIVTSLAAELVNRNARDLYITINAGSSQSNNASTIKFGYCHSGDHQRCFIPVVQSTVAGAELVVTIEDEEVLRTDASEPKFDEQFTQRISRIYLSGLRSLFKEE